MIRTITGWKAAVETCPPPETGSNCSGEAATGVPTKVWQVVVLVTQATTRNMVASCVSDSVTVA